MSVAGDQKTDDAVMASTSPWVYAQGMGVAASFYILLMNHAFTEHSITHSHLDLDNNKYGISHNDVAWGTVAIFVSAVLFAFWRYCVRYENAVNQKVTAYIGANTTDKSEEQKKIQASAVTRAIRNDWSCWNPDRVNNVRILQKVGALHDQTSELIKAKVDAAWLGKNSLVYTEVAKETAIASIKNLSNTPADITDTVVHREIDRALYESMCELIHVAWINRDPKYPKNGFEADWKGVVFAYVKKTSVSSTNALDVIVRDAAKALKDEISSAVEKRLSAVAEEVVKKKTQHILLKAAVVPDDITDESFNEAKLLATLQVRVEAIVFTNDVIEASDRILGCKQPGTRDPNDMSKVNFAYRTAEGAIRFIRAEVQHETDLTPALINAAINQAKVALTVAQKVRAAVWTADKLQAKQRVNQNGDRASLADHHIVEAAGELEVMALGNASQELKKKQREMHGKLPISTNIHLTYDFWKPANEHWFMLTTADVTDELIKQAIKVAQAHLSLLQVRSYEPHTAYSNVGKNKRA